MMHNELLSDLRALREVRAPDGLLTAVMDELKLGDQYASLESPLGPVFVAWNAHGVSAVMKTSTAEDFEARFRERYGRSVRPAPHDAGRHLHPNPLRRGRGDMAQVAFDLRSVTEFERAVLLKALEIPRGELRTYGWIAAQIGRPGAVRAVGSALRKNPVPVLIPCHRVVRSDGAVGEYALGGSDAKRRMLASEGIEAAAIHDLAQHWRATPRVSSRVANG
jgi:O-6-methylguanine DNA methyltransferase